MARGRDKFTEIAWESFELLDAWRWSQMNDNRLCLQPNQHQPTKPLVVVQAPPEKSKVIEPPGDRNYHESHRRVDDREDRRVVDGPNQHEPPKPRVVVQAPEKQKAMEYHEPRGDRNNHESNRKADCRKVPGLFFRV
ncbi:hypothetical protein NMG60_11025051 [Bertholletia excelsa]